MHLHDAAISSVDDAEIEEEAEGDAEDEVDIEDKAPFTRTRHEHATVSWQVCDSSSAMHHVAACTAWLEKVRSLGGEAPCHAQLPRRSDAWPYFCVSVTGWFHHKSPWSSCSRLGLEMKPPWSS